MSVYWPLSVLFAFVCVISNQGRVLEKTTLCVRPLNLMPCCIKHTSRFDMCRPHPFSQRNKTTGRELGLGVEGNREGEGSWTKFEKREGRQYKGDLHKMVGLRPLCYLWFLEGF